MLSDERRPRESGQAGVSVKGICRILLGAGCAYRRTFKEIE